MLLAEAGRPLGGRRHRQVLQPYTHTHSGEVQCLGSGFRIGSGFNQVSGSSVADPDSNPEVLLAEAGRPLGGGRNRHVLQPCNQGVANNVADPDPEPDP